ncbi:proteoglycan 4-like [Osmia bicornis bicornis]|uniref:proteoglycan 4-like n=1 Tax=Osmia bicornis bicornis TaxID=1437191 RepID=UPI001EAF8969|nr:proteoglycan 4-like [Osmia bicornis bicornis]
MAAQQREEEIAAAIRRLSVRERAQDEPLTLTPQEWKRFIRMSVPREGRCGYQPPPTREASRAPERKATRPSRVQTPVRRPPLAMLTPPKRTPAPLAPGDRAPRSPAKRAAAAASHAVEQGMGNPAPTHREAARMTAEAVVNAAVANYCRPPSPTPIQAPTLLPARTVDPKDPTNTTPYTLTDGTTARLCKGVRRHRFTRNGRRWTINTDHRGNVVRPPIPPVAPEKSTTPPAASRAGIGASSNTTTSSSTVGEAENTVADALSRQTAVAAITRTKCRWYTSRVKETHENPENTPDYCIRDGRLIPPQSPSPGPQRRLGQLETLHPQGRANGYPIRKPRQANSGPPRSRPNNRQTRSKIYWPGMFTDTASTCEHAQHVRPIRYQQQQPPGRMLALAATRPAQIVSATSSEPLPRSAEGTPPYSIMQDKFTKWVETKPLERQPPSHLRAFKEQVILRHGCPDTVVTDNGRSS